MSYVGIDVGSSYIKIWSENASGDVLSTRYVHHGGSPRKALLKELSGLAPDSARLCFSGSFGSDGLGKFRQEGLLPEIEYLRNKYPQRRLLVMGAEKIELIHYDDLGKILHYQSNPSCAAGTGSFLDEQMLRLGLEFKDLPSVAIDDEAPLVATRCAVFAKTDLIHLQQEGYSSQAMYNGLCKGLVLSSLKSVFGGNLSDGGNLIAAGGLLENPHIRHFLKKIFPRTIVADKPAFTRARGLCRLSRIQGMSFGEFMELLAEQKPVRGPDLLHTPLRLTRSEFPYSELKRISDDHGNEVWHDLHASEALEAYLGVDIGSTSTKAVLIDSSSRIRIDIYTRTAGNPIEAARRIFSSISALRKKLDCSITVQGCGTTGSGRKLVGSVIGADLIVNEISAHAKGAMTLDEQVETIFEIGGQDAKFIRLESGRIVDVNMNYVCAAGTGSFVEEQARTLGISLDEIGDLVMGVTPLPNSDRCTVFMNQEITRQISMGRKKEEVMAGVLLAVFRNYLSRVVGYRRYSSRKIVFQGATARNRGLVAALEQLTGAQIMVSPFCHVMGAYGAALLTRQKLDRPSSFRGFDLPEISIRERTCRGCENACRITLARVGAEKTSWGYLCGREPGETPPGKKTNPCLKVREELLETYRIQPEGKRETFLMPALGLNEEFIPYLNEIAAACGFTIDMCLPDKETVLRELAVMSPGDFCYPVKVSMASVNVLLKENPSSRILLPCFIQDRQDPSIRPRSVYCPFITALPALFRQDARRIASPEIDLSRSISRQAGRIRDFLADAGLAPVPLPRIKSALRRGLAGLEQHRKGLEAGAGRVRENLPGGRKAVVLMGRPYNLYHRILNLGIPELVESLGYPVITMDAIPDDADNREVTELFPDMYWYQGQRLLRKALSISRDPDLFPLMISNFSCGPDSFILSYLERIFRDKPYLILELDEHGSATGYQTRIEAFLDMIEQYRDEHQPPAPLKRPSRICHRLEDLREKTRIWIPQIHPYTPQLWSATLRHYGFDTYAAGEESEAECAAGRSHCRGSECLPAAVTTGKFLSLARNSPGECMEVLFMPRAEGPCRFGQYATLQSMILEQEGLGKTRVFSPTSENGYSFLPPGAEMKVWKAVCLGDALFKLRCRTIPYHRDPGQADALFREALDEICFRILRGRDYRSLVIRLVRKLRTEVDLLKHRKPQVGIVGEIFVRLNTFSNQHIVETVESHGGEAWLSPLSEWIHYIWELLARNSSLFRKPWTYFKKYLLHAVEKEIMDLFSPVLDDRHEPDIRHVLEKGRRYVPVSFEGEAILTLGRAKIFAEQGASLIVNCSPFSCMPGRITSYLFQSCREDFQAPVVNLVYDGIGDVSSRVEFYLKSLHDDKRRGQAATFRAALPRTEGTVFEPEQDGCMIPDRFI